MVESSVLLWLRDEIIISLDFGQRSEHPFRKLNCISWDQQGETRSGKSSPFIQISCKEVAKSFIEATSAVSYLDTACSMHKKLSARKYLFHFTQRDPALSSQVLHSLSLQPPTSRPILVAFLFSLLSVMHAQSANLTLPPNQTCYFSIFTAISHTFYSVSTMV
jgi:hypothetical protein